MFLSQDHAEQVLQFGNPVLRIDREALGGGLFCLIKTLQEVISERTVVVVLGKAHRIQLQ